MLRRLLLIFGAVALVVGMWTAVGDTGQPGGACPSPSPGPPTPTPIPPSATPGPPTATPGPTASPCPSPYPLNVATPGPGGDVALPPLSDPEDSGFSRGEIAVVFLGFVLPVAVAVVVATRRGRQASS